MSLDNPSIPGKTEELLKAFDNPIEIEITGSKGDGVVAQAMADILYKSAKEQGVELNIWTPSDPELAQIFGKFEESWQQFDYEIKELTDKLDGRIPNYQVFLEISKSFKRMSPLVMENLFARFVENKPDLLIINSGQYALMYPLIRHFDIPFAIADPYFLCDKRIASSGQIASNLLPPIPGFMNKAANVAIRWVFENLFAVHAKNNYKKMCAKFGEEFNPEAKVFSPEDAQLSINYANPTYGDVITVSEDGTMKVLGDIFEDFNPSCVIMPRGLPVSGIENTIPTRELEFIQNSTNPVMVVINGATSSDIDAQKEMLSVLAESTKANNTSYIIIDVGHIPKDLKLYLPENVMITDGMINLNALTFGDIDNKIIGWINHGGSGITSILELLGVPGLTVYAVEEQLRNGTRLFETGLGMKPISRGDVFVNAAKNEKQRESQHRKNSNRFMNYVEVFKAFSRNITDRRRSENEVNDYLTLQQQRLRYLTNVLLRKVIEAKLK